MNAEFDKYIDRYRENLDKSLSISGETSDFFAQYKAKKLKEWLSYYTNSPIKILDFGCGDGLMTYYVSQEFSKATVYGTDPSPKSIQVAQQKYQDINFSVNSDSNTTLNFENELFDVIFAAGAFHHIPFELHKGYMQELLRILKPGGMFVMFELNPLNPLTVRTFRRNPIDFNAKMLTPWYAYSLTNNYGSSGVRFYCFFPKFLNWLRPVERFLIKLPVGALYAVIMKK